MCALICFQKKPFMESHSIIALRNFFDYLELPIIYLNMVFNYYFYICFLL
jgi:hypothetical protein